MGGVPHILNTTAVLPVKRFDGAYQRLASTLAPEDRRRLAEATFQDTLSKLRRCRTIDDVLVVTADPAVVRHCNWLGYPVLQQDDDHGHSEAALAGARAAQAAGAERVAMVPIDCPLLDPAELDAHLGQSPRTALIVPDAEGTGTNALVLCPPDAFEPAFGPDSCARHVSRARAAGISFALESLRSLGPDLDTLEDMEQLRDALLLDPAPAPRTAKVLWELGAAAAEPPVAAA
jgi:2-phospho-L-lactate guanylyltransferase